MSSDAGFSAISQLATMGTTFLVGIMVSRALGPAGKGQLALLQQVPWSAYMALNLGLGGAHAYFVGRKRRSAGQAFSDSLAAAALTTIIGVPAMIAAIAFVFPSLQGLPVATRVVAATLLPAMLLNAYASSIAVGLGRVRQLAATQSALAIASLVMVGIAFVTGALTVGVAVAIQLVSLAAATALIVLSWRDSSAKLLVRPSVERLAEQASFAWRAYLTEFTSYLSLRQDLLILGVLSSARSIGIYSVGVAFTELLWLVPNSVAQGLFSRSVRVGEFEGAETAAAVARIAVMVMAAAAVAVGLSIGPAVTLLYGQTFAGAGKVFAVLAPGVILMGVGRTLSNYLAAHGKLVPGIAATATILNLLGNLVAIPKFGFLGAAAVSAVTYSTAGVLIVLVFCRRTAIPLRRVLLPGSDDVRILLSRLTRMMAHARRRS